MIHIGRIEFLESEIFDTDGDFCGHIERACAAAVAAGKDFLLWNDRIYLLTPAMRYYDTHLTRKDLSRHKLV